MNTNAEKDLSNIVKQNDETPKRRKSSSRILYDVTEPTVKTHIGQRMSQKKGRKLKHGQKSVLYISLLRKSTNLKTLDIKLVQIHLSINLLI